MYVCRKADPESKGKIENLVGFVKKNFLQVRICDTLEDASCGLASWLSRRANGRISSATGMIPAHFPVQKTLEAFEFNKVKGICKSDVSNLMDCAWLDRHENILLFGPPGVGKTHLSIALGKHALNKGSTACFLTDYKSDEINKNFPDSKNFQILEESTGLF